MPERYPPDDPREWMNRARSNLAVAKLATGSIYLEDLCFNAQQAVEKATKALLMKLDIEFPYIHDIAQLMTLLERAGQEIPGFAREAEQLTQFAVFSRYPGLAPPVKREEYDKAVATAEQVIRWIEGLLSDRIC